MHTGMVLVIILVVLLAALVLAAIYRLIMLRRGGTAAILRVLPAHGGERWRHGVIRYGESRLVFYKLSSLRFGPDSVVWRRTIDLGQRRGPVGDEYDIMTDDIVIMGLSDGHGSFELALDRGSMAAFLSWVESRPSQRSRWTGRRLG